MSSEGAVVAPTWTLADRMRKAREAAGFDQSALARSLGISRNSVSNYETGRTHPHQPVRELWAQRCGVPYEWLTGGEPAG